MKGGEEITPLEGRLDAVLFSTCPVSSVFNASSTDGGVAWEEEFYQKKTEKGAAMKTKVFLGSVVSLVLMFVLVTSSVAASSAPQTIAVGAIVSLSGFDSNLGHQAKAGYEMVVEDINASGGDLVKEYGKKIPLEVIVQDMESNPQKAVSRMEYLQTSKAVVAYVGTTFISAGSGVAEKNKIPTLWSPLRCRESMREASNTGFRL